MLKPRRLWTGKQVLTAILEHITHGRAPMTVAHGTKTPANAWGGDTTRRGRRCSCGRASCSGVLDKNLRRKFGLVHAVAELGGRVLAGDFISALGKLFTAYQQMHGMTCGMDDLLLTPGRPRPPQPGSKARSHSACRGVPRQRSAPPEERSATALREQIAARLREREGGRGDAGHAKQRRAQ